MRSPTLPIASQRLNSQKEKKVFLLGPKAQDAVKFKDAVAYLHLVGEGQRIQ